MSELNINDLPREIIIQVLRYLDGKNLKNATLTCKLWKNLIEAACRWSLSLECNTILSNFMENMHFILTTNRKFESIEIMGWEIYDDEHIIKMFQKHGFHFVKLKMFEGLIYNLTTFAKMLCLTPNLKRVEMYSIKLYDMQFVELDGASDVPLDQVLPDLIKLKSLKVYQCDSGIVKCFRKAKLSKIKIHEEEPLQHCDSWIHFLSTQDMLTSLTADSDSSSPSLSPSIPIAMGKLNVPIQFRLTQLAISDVDDEESSHDNFLRFVKSQAEHLNYLELGINIPHWVYECIFTSMTQLETLSVEIQDIPQDFDFYLCLEENISVRTIKLSAVYMDNRSWLHTAFIANFLRKLPNIRSLILPDQFVVCNSTMTMAQTAGKVESLSVYAVNQSLIDFVKFPHLRTLQIGKLRGKVNWNEFTKIHCRLAELTIQQIGDESFLTSDDIDEITTNVKLQTIRLGLGFVADDRFFEIIRTKGTNLKVLELHESCVSDKLNLMRMKFIK